MVIDVHAHLWTHAYLDCLTAAGIDWTDMYYQLGATDSQADLDARFELMDRAGIDRQILSSAPLAPHLPDEPAAVAAARQVNDEYAELIATHPDRFLAFASLPLPHMDAALEELARALDDLSFVGVAVTTDILGKTLSDSIFQDLLGELDRRGGVLYVHPAGQDARSGLITGRPMRWSVGAPIEDTIALADLLVQGIPARYPRMRIVGSHLGGALPMVLPRMDAQQPWESPDTPESPSQGARRMWFDTVAHDNRPALRAAADVLGADRLVLGTDFPFQPGAEFLTATANVRDELSASQADDVLSGNATRLFNSRMSNNCKKQE
nr:amidohydrolase family protein [Flexivirga meconopsidis]